MMGGLAIFGAARGIGLSFTLAQLSEYDHIYLFDISEAIIGVQNDMRKRGVACTACVLDVSDVSSMKQSLDSLLAPASIQHICYFIRNKNKPDFKDISSKQWDDEFDVTLKGAFFAVQSLLPFINSSVGPAVVFVSSICAGLVGAETVSYHASKAGIEALTKYLAVNLGDIKVRVNAVRLGFIVQDENKERFYSDANTVYREAAISGHPVGRIGHVDDVIDPINFLLSPSASFITGHTLNIDGGLSLHEQGSLVLKGVI